jgi:hypothetical protein
VALRVPVAMPDLDLYSAVRLLPERQLQRAYAPVVGQRFDRFRGALDGPRISGGMSSANAIPLAFPTLPFRRDTSASNHSLHLASASGSSPCSSTNSLIAKPSALVAIT